MRLLSLFLFTGLVAGCATDPETPAETSELVEVATPSVPDALTVTEPFTPAAPAGGTGGVFLTVQAGSDADTLVAARYAGAERVEVHETFEANGGMRGMREVEAGIPVPAAGTVALEPGGYHVMLIGLEAGTAAGDSLDLALDFAQAGEVSVRVPVVSLDQIRRSDAE